jgi:DNA invertase Pin-like site-specific DNA recombinase
LSKLFLTIAAAFAEAERDRIRERIGQARADQNSATSSPLAPSAVKAKCLSEAKRPIALMHVDFLSAERENAGVGP